MLRHLQELGFEFEISEALAEFVTFEREGIEIFRRRHLCGLERKLSRSTANNHSKVVRGTGRSAEKVHLLGDELQHRCRIENGLGLLEQVALVGGAATLCHEEEFVGIAIDCADFDFGGKVGAGVDLAIHVERSHLRVAKVVGFVGVKDTA